MKNTIKISLLFAALIATISVSNAQGIPRDPLEKSVGCMRLNFIAANVILDLAKARGDTGVNSKWMPRGFLFNERGELKKREINESYVKTKRITTAELEKMKAKYNEKIVVELTKKLEALDSLTPEAVTKVFADAGPVYGCSDS